MGMFVDLFQRRIWLGPLIGIVIGLAIGLPIGWFTVDFKASRDDVRAAAEAYMTNNDANLAKQRLGSLSKEERDQYIKELYDQSIKSGKTIEAQRLACLSGAIGSTAVQAPCTLAPASGVPPIIVPTVPISGAVSSISSSFSSSSAGIVPTRTVATPTAVATPAASGGGLIDTLLPIALVFIVLVLGAVAVIIFFTRILPKLNLRKPRRAAGGEEPTSAPAPRGGRATGPAPTPTVPGGLGRFVPQYTLGNDNYDTSYSLETPQGEFLGECGMGISETIGEGKPDKVTAFDLWLFDKADVRTVTQIVMSEYAYNDPALRTKLRDKGEAILAERGKTIRLETQSLRIEAQIVELVYASNPNFAPNSHFQKLIVEIVPTLKSGTR